MYIIQYVIREMHIETMRYHCTLMRMCKVQNTDNTKCNKDAEQKINKNKTKETKENHSLNERLVFSFKTKHILTI